MKCKVERIIVEKKSFQVKFEGLTGGTWVSITERSRGFVVSIGFDMEELDWLMEHLKKAVEREVHENYTICYKKETFISCHPEGVKGKGWEDLRKAILSVQEYSKRDGGASKEKNGDIRMNGDTFRGGRSYAEVVAEASLRTGGRAIARMMGMKGMVSINHFRFQRMLLFEFHFEEMGEGNEGGKGNFEAGGLDEAKLWVEMLPNVVLPALLEVEDGEWSYTVAVSVTGEAEDVDAVTSKINRSRNKWVRVGGCVSQSSKAAKGLQGSVKDIECYRKRRLPRARYRQSRTCLADKGEIGGGWSRSGPAEANFIGESSFKAHKVSAQSGMRHRGLQDGPKAPQAHQSASASSLSPQRAASSTKAIVMLCPDDARAGAEVFFREEGRAVELKAQSLPNPRPWSDNTVGCKFKGPSGLGQNLGGTKPSGMEVWSRREEIEARKGKAPAVHTRDATQEEETAISKKTWSTLFPPSADRRQGHRCSSEPIFTRGSSSSSEDRNMEEEFGMGFQMERGIRVNPLSRCPLSGNLSKEDTSASRVEVKGGLTGRVWFDPRGYSDMVSPSNSIIKGKGLIFEGFCEIPRAKNLEVCQPSPSQPPESPSFPSCSPDSPLTNPSGPLLPNSVPLPQSPTENQGISKKFYEKMTESCTPKESIVRSHKEDSGDFLIDGLSPGKMAKVREVLCSLDIKETKKENCDRRFVGSVWTVRNKDWVALPASGALGGILIIWDSKNLHREEVVIGSFSVSVKFSLDGCGPLWISAVYGPNNPSLRKDFWVELFDIYGLTYPLWCVGGDFNVIRRSSEKMGGSSLTPSMRDFDSFIRECELLDPPLRNASFT
ncbi:hypothetical protein CK203_027327 [Vitis vinifera]|uniref:DUF4283 domain-containing protein n=1 Tax=Vitis vinifera TaxID=29760 RepID=A0A438J9Z0_VITVI|nr:hypothetical protein CK203_027327 [Vitis vinifera]